MTEPLPLVPRMYNCESCDRPWPVKSAAETCAEQDEVEDRVTRRILRSSN